MHEKTERLSHFASQLGLQLNTNKTDEMRFNVTSSNKPKVDGKEIKQVDKFIYLGSVVSIEDSTQKEHQKQIIKGKHGLPQAKTYMEIKPIQQENKNKAIQQQC